jgi:hypothetical protein
LGALSGDNGRLVREPKLRAVLPESSGERAELRFRYQGRTQRTALLKSGLERQQIGLKLRARDSCNVIYVMWRTAPESRIVVSVKDNAEASSHTECENAGYSSLRPVEQRSPPVAAVGAIYVLTAVIAQNSLLVTLNGDVVWRGDLPGAAKQLRGPAGMRSDNVTWELLEFDAE